MNETRRASSNRLRIATTREAQLAELVARSPVRLGRDNVLHGPSDDSASATERSPLALRALLDAGTALSSVRGLAALGRPLLDLIFDVIRAERGALLLTGAEPHTVVAAKPPAPAPSQDSPLLVSRTMVERALRDVVALSSNDVQMSRRVGGERGARRSVMVAPVVAFDEPLGVVYLETQDHGVRFTEDDLRLLAMLAGMAALAIENFSYGERLDDAARGSHRRLTLADDMVGHSGAIQEVHRCIARAAPTDATVLIRGESGTGKELVARAIHRNSTRCTRPFIAISCAAIPETLLESELFGHEQGAFTGAVRQKKGKLELADGGTLFLDEVGELPVTLQPKLLRVLQERVFERVGGTVPIRVDIRLIAATNASLEAAVKRGTFRSDLYYRLHVVPIEIPPLRERRDDIVQLAEFMAARCAERLRQPVKAITPAAAALLMQYDWPGNVRELENAVERAVVLGSGPVLAPEDLPREIRENRRVDADRGGPYRAAMLRARRDLIIDAFRQAGGSYVEAAHLLGVHPNYLHRLIRTLDLKAALRQIH